MSLRASGTLLICRLHGCYNIALNLLSIQALPPMMMRIVQLSLHPHHQLNSRPVPTPLYLHHSLLLPLSLPSLTTLSQPPCHLPALTRVLFMSPNRGNGSCPPHSVNTILQITLLHYNARNIFPKLDHLKVESEIHMPHIICITET